MNSMRFLVCLLCCAVLAGCTSTPKPTMTQAQLTANEPDREKIFDVVVNLMEPEATTGNADAQMLLSNMYSLSQQQERRKQALPWLEKLEAKHHKGSILLLVRYELEGAAGTISLTRWQKYQTVLPTIAPEYAHSVKEFSYLDEALRMSQMAKMQALVTRYSPLCEQPVAQFATPLPNDFRATLTVNYLKQCLVQYSGKNAQARYQAVSEISQLFCTYDNPNTQCSAPGYLALTRDHLQTTDMKAASYAVYELLKANQDWLKFAAHSLTKDLRRQSQERFSHAMLVARADNAALAITALENMTSNGPLPPYDLAIRDMLLADLLSQQPTTAQQTRAIALFEQSQRNEWLPSDDRWKCFLALQELYIKTGRYQAMLQSSIDHISRNQGHMELLPPAFVTAFTRFTTPAPTPMVAPSN